MALTTEQKAVPLVQRSYFLKDFYLERALPARGRLLLRVGDTVEPFTKVGTCEISGFAKKLPKGFKLTTESLYIEKGKVFAKKNASLFKALTISSPTSGFVRKDDYGDLIFEQEKTTSTVLSGSWGTVERVDEGKAVLIKGSANVLSFALSTNISAEGELIVLPNPSELLEDPYFTDFTKDLRGKVLYTGAFISATNLQKAVGMGVSAILCGGCDKKTFDLALSLNVSLNVFTGFGRIPTPKYLFKLLDSVSNRYVFVHGRKKSLYIPVEQSSELSSEICKDFSSPLKLGMLVQVLQRPYFGWSGIIEKLENSMVQVKLEETGEIVFVRDSNVIALWTGLLK